MQGETNFDVQIVEVIAMGPARKEPDMSTYSGRCAVRLRKLREKAGLTIEDVAVACDCTTRTIYKWESGQTYPVTKMLPQLADLYEFKSPRMILAEK